MDFKPDTTYYFKYGIDNTPVSCRFNTKGEKGITVMLYDGKELKETAGLSPQKIVDEGEQITEKEFNSLTS